MVYNRNKGGGTVKVGQDPAKKKPSGMSRAAKNTHNAYQRNYTKNHRQAKREANKRYWEKKTHGGWGLCSGETRESSLQNARDWAEKRFPPFVSRCDEMKSRWVRLT